MKLEENDQKRHFKGCNGIKHIVNGIALVVGVIVLHIVLYELVKLKVHFIQYFVIMDIIVTSIVIYFFVNSTIQQKQIHKFQVDMDFLEQQNSCLLELNDGVRSFKHDFNNIIQAIDGYILLDDMEALHIYFDNLLKECNHLKNVEVLASKKITNPAIYGILLNKFKIAEKRNVQMNIDILTDFQKIDEKSYGISRMLGILLDNAIEASVECEDKIVNVQFLQSNQENKKSILIENTFLDKGIDTKKIFEKNYTTKEHKGNTGLGLWKVRNILSKDHNLILETTTDGEMFKQKIEIFF